MFHYKIKVCLTVFLFFVFVSVSSAKLAPIIVTATKLPQEISSQPWNSTVISSQQIESSGAKTVGEILNLVSGLDLSSNGYLGGAATARLRGASSQQTLVLLDGRRINSPTLGLADLGIIPIQNIQKIEIVKAPLSAIYGSDAIGGVINIITKKTSKKRKFSLAYESGEFDTRTYRIQSSGPRHNLSFDNTISSGFRTNSDYDAKNYFASFSLNKLNINFQRNEDAKGSPGSLVFPSSTAREKNENNYIDFSFNRKKAGFSSRSYINILESSYNDPTFFIDSQNKVATYGWEANKTLGDFLLGLDLRRDVSRSNDSGEHSIDAAGIFFQNKFNLKNGFIFAGARSDFFSNSNFELSPRAGIVLFTPRDLILKASWARGFKTPTINDLYWSAQSFAFGGMTSTTVGNPNLKSEIGNSFDVSLEKYTEAGSFRSTVYLNQINDMIRWETTTTATSVTYQPINIDDAQIFGVELELIRKLGKNFKTFFNYTWQDAQNKTSGTLITYSPKNKYNLGLIFDNSILSINLTQRFVGERFADLLNSRKLPGYSVTDMNVSRKINRLKISGRVENLFNVNYQEIADYPQPGRRYTVGIGLDLIN